MFISDTKIEEIKDAVDIVDLIGSYVSLVKRGRNYVGLCPFHNEKTPSFSVNPDGHYFKCFGCGKSGDAITFLQEYEGLDFNEAIKELAEKAHIDLGEAEFQKKQADYSVYYDINREAALYFMDNIKLDEAAISYLKNRNINVNSVLEFGIGFALDSWDGLLNHLTQKGFSINDIEAANLIQKSEKRGTYYDLFRKRLIFPILDLKSRVVGFSGRIVGDGEPKYYNSRDSVIFKKGNLLFGLNLVQKKSDRSRIMLVEGNIDVVKLHQMGINYVVAALGTAFTDRQATLLKRYGKEVYLCLDGDFAGQKATVRDIEILRNIGVVPKIVVIPDNMDPDEYVDKFGKDKFDALLQDAVSAFDFTVSFYKRDLDINRRDDFIEFIRRVSGLIKTIPSKVEQSIYVEDISKKYNIDKNLLMEELSKNNEVFVANAYDVKSYTIPKASNKFIKILISYIITDKVFAVEAEKLNVLDYINNPSYADLIERIFKEYEKKEKIDVDEFTKSLINENELGENLVKSMLSHVEIKEPTINYFNDVVDGIKREYISDKKDVLNKKIESATNDKDFDLVVELLKELDSLSEMDGD